MLTKAILSGSLFFILLVQSASAQQTSNMNTAVKSGHAPVNGLNMYYEIYGDGGLPLVLIHGGGSTIETTFGNILPFFAAHGKVIAVELQAHGRTSDRDAPESFEQDADDVAGLLKYLNINKANILGFSNGGTTTLQIAMRHPALVNKIVAISANYRRDGMMEGFFESMPHATLDNMPGPLKENYLKLTNNKKGLQTMFEKDRDRMISFKDISDDSIQSIKAPALLMVAQHDVMSVDHVLKLSQLIANSQFAVLPGVHGSFIGEICTYKKGSRLPELTASMIEEFLNE